MSHAGYVLGGWAAVLLAVAVYAVWVVVKGRRLASRFDRDELPWG